MTSSQLLTPLSTYLPNKLTAGPVVFMEARQPGDPPHKAMPLRNMGLIWPYQEKPMVSKPLIRPYFWGGCALGGVG